MSWEGVREWRVGRLGKVCEWSGLAMVGKVCEWSEVARSERWECEEGAFIEKSPKKGGRLFEGAFKRRGRLIEALR